MALRRFWKKKYLAVPASALAFALAPLGCGESPPPAPATPAAAPAPEPEAGHHAKKKRDHRSADEKNMGIEELREQRRKEAGSAAPAG